MIYLDNAATTNYKPDCVVRTVNDCLTKYPFNLNRSGKISLPLELAVKDIRKKLSLIFNNDGENHVVFTHGCTHALNLALLGTAERGHVIVSATEHNSILRPLWQLKKRGFVDISIVNPDKSGQISVESLQKALRKDTYLLCVSQASNVTGKQQKLAQLGHFAKSNNLLFLVDCAQSAGYYPTDMAKNNVDMVAIPSHKGLHAMQGAGALIFTKRAIPRPTIFGGTGTESHLLSQPTTLPEGLESGTMPLPAILSMGAGVDFWLKNHQQNAHNVQKQLQLLLDGLGSIPTIKIYSQPNKSGIVAFNVGNFDSGFVCDALAERQIVVRGGLHCAPLMHNYLGTQNQGTVRASVSCATTKQDCYALLNAVNDFAKFHK